MEKGVKFSVDLAVNKVLTETEKSQLMEALSETIQKVLGKTESGTVLIYSEKPNPEVG